MRLSYMPTQPLSDPASATAYTQLSARRSPKPLQALDLALLHSPHVASGWSSFLGAIRTQTSLPSDIRELCICRVAVLNNAAYEWEYHVPLLRSEGSLSEEAIEQVKKRKAWQGWEEFGEGNVNSVLFDTKQRAVLSYCDAMTISVKVGEDIFSSLRNAFTEKEVVEITTTVAAYNCVSRFLVALDVGESNEKELRS